MDPFTLAEHVAETLDVGPGTRVFEVDCGSGEFLYPFYVNSYIVGGSDADGDAIAMAVAAMPHGAFYTGVSAALDPAAPWDVVMCRSLAGTDDLDHLRGVLARMYAKATHAIALIDVPDARREWMLRALAEIGATAVQFETASGGDARCNVFARV